MPQNGSQNINAQWVMVTDANVTEITFQVTGEYAVFALGTNGTGQPAANEHGLRYGPGEGEAKRLLADLFPGISGVNRLWLRSTSAATQVFVSHA